MPLPMARNEDRNEDRKRLAEVRTTDVNEGNLNEDFVTCCLLRHDSMATTSNTRSRRGLD